MSESDALNARIDSALATPFPRPSTAWSPAQYWMREHPFAIVWVASAAAWMLLLLTIPYQDFPLGDDWAFSRGVFLWARGQGIHYSKWAAMPQLGQWLWALPFIRMFGESHTLLRATTVLLSWLGLWSFHTLLCREGLTPAQAALATAAVAFNPLFFLLQGTFMTDVPALSFGLIAVNGYSLALARRSLGWLSAAALTATMASLTRQNAAAAALAGAVLLARNKELRKQLLWWAAVSLPILAGVAGHFWLQSRSDVVPYRAASLRIEGYLLLVFSMLHLAGLSALPVLILRPGFPQAKWSAGCLIGMLATTAFLWFTNSGYLDNLFPYLTGVLGAGGPFSTLLQPGTGPIFMDIPVRVLCSVLGCLGAAALAGRLVALIRARTAWGPLMIFGAWQVPMLFLGFGLYDRYFLPLLPAVMVIAATSPLESRDRLHPALCALLIFGIISVGLMHDWLSWNEARWALGKRALARGWKPADVEGGMEWNGWFSPNPRPVTRTQKPRLLRLPFTAGFFPHVNGRVALSFSPLRGTRVLDSEAYSLWLLAKHERFYLLEPILTGRPGAVRDGD